jgi:hypothetical protein
MSQINVDTIQNRDGGSGPVLGGNSVVSGILTATGGVDSVGDFKVSGSTIITSDNQLGTGLASAFDRVFTVGVSTTLQNRDFCTATSSGLTITLPSSPTPGNEVKIAVQNFIDTVVGRNGSNIMSLAQDLTINAENADVGLIYVNSTVGWRVF